MNKRVSYFIALIILFASCGNPQELVYQDVKNFDIKELSLTPNIGMDVQFYNPNKFGMTMKNADVYLYLNGSMVGHAVLEKEYQVPAEDTFLLPVNLQTDLNGVLSNALVILSNKKIDVELKGTVKAGRGVFLNIPIHYKGEQELNITGF